MYISRMSQYITVYFSIASQTVYTIVVTILKKKGWNRVQKGLIRVTQKIRRLKYLYMKREGLGLWILRDWIIEKDAFNGKNVMGNIFPLSKTLGLLDGDDRCKVRIQKKKTPSLEQMKENR